jgi:hypothetical protein
MERLVSVSRNLFAQKIEKPEGAPGPEFLPLVEIVLVTIEQEYRAVMQPSPIEGGQPKFGLGKAPVAKTYRFLADQTGLQAMLQTVADSHGEISGTEDLVEDPHEPGPEYTGPRLIV